MMLGLLLLWAEEQLSVGDFSALLLRHCAGSLRCAAERWRNCIRCRNGVYL